MMHKPMLLLAAAALAATAWETGRAQVLPSDSTGMGPYMHGQKDIDDMLSRLRMPRPAVPALTNSIVTRPVTVTGVGPQTVVSGNIIVNPGSAPDSQVSVRCRIPHGRVVVRGNIVLNEGRITSSGGGQVGQIVADCADGTSITDEGNAYFNDGQIKGR